MSDKVVKIRGINKGICDICGEVKTLYILGPSRQLCPDCANMINAGVSDNHGHSGYLGCSGYLGHSGYSGKSRKEEPTPCSGVILNTSIKPITVEISVEKVGKVKKDETNDSNKSGKKLTLGKSQHDFLKKKIKL